MKIWTFITDLLKDHRDEDNFMEVMDVTLSIYTLENIQIVFKMQDIQI